MDMQCIPREAHPKIHCRTRFRSASPQSAHPGHRGSDTSSALPAPRTHTRHLHRYCGRGFHKETSRMLWISETLHFHGRLAGLTSAEPTKMSRRAGALPDEGQQHAARQPAKPTPRASAGTRGPIWPPAADIWPASMPNAPSRACEAMKLLFVCVAGTFLASDTVLLQQKRASGIHR